MIKNIAACFLVIAWMIVIFMLSNSDGVTSSATSGHLTDKIMEILSITVEDVNYESIRSDISSIVRKTAHFTEYFILGLLLMNMMFVIGIKSNRIILSVIVVLLYAISDELHQGLIAGRYGYVGDVFLDSSAGLIAIYFYYSLIMLRFNYEKNIN